MWLYKAMWLLQLPPPPFSSLSSHCVLHVVCSFEYTTPSRNIVMAATFRWEKILGMKWAEEQAVRSPSPAGGEGDREGGSGGVTGAEDAHCVMAGRVLMEEAVFAGDRGGGIISQAEGGEGAQQGERQDFVGLSGKKLVPNKHDSHCAIVLVLGYGCILASSQYLVSILSLTKGLAMTST